MNKPKPAFTGTHWSCKVCNKVKPVVEFEWPKGRPNPRKRCKECRYSARDKATENKKAADRKKRWHSSNRDRLRINWERAKYGVCKEDLGKTVCDICGGSVRLSIDHDHKTGKVRGLLCSPCNAGLGMFRDNAAIMIAAIKYLGDAE